MEHSFNFESFITGCNSIELHPYYYLESWVGEIIRIIEIIKIIMTKQVTGHDLGLRVTSGTSISSSEMPPCWKVPV